MMNFNKIAISGGQGIESVEHRILYSVNVPQDVRRFKAVIFFKMKRDSKVVHSALHRKIVRDRIWRILTR